MLLYGPNIKTQSSHSLTPQAALTLSQLVMFNSFVNCRGGITNTLRHKKDRENPLPLYLGVLIHNKTREKELVDALFELGLCVSNDRVMTISTSLRNSLCHYFNIDQAVCPPKLKGELFTTAAIDDIDHNPSSTSAECSFHGTNISICQHPQNKASGLSRKHLNAFSGDHLISE